MSLKLILLACLIGATFSLVLGGTVSENDCECEEPEVVDSYKWWEASGYDGYLKSLEYLEGKVKCIEKKPEDFCLYSDNKSWSVSYNEAVDVVSKMSVLFGYLIENIFPELGHKFNDMCFGHFRVYACLFLRADKLREADCDLIQPDLCTKADYGSEWGYHSCYNGDYSSATEIIEGHGLVNISQQIDNILCKYDDGKGLEGFDVDIRNSIGSIKKLAAIIDRLRGYTSFRPQALIKALREFFTVYGGIANNLMPGYGTEFMKDFFGFYDIAYRQPGYVDISCVKDQILQQISTCGTFNWAQERKVECDETSQSQSQSQLTEQSSN